MADSNTSMLERVQRARAQSGLGTCCAEAQADGVPCTILGRDCEICERALAAAQLADVAIWPNLRTESARAQERQPLA